MHLDPLLPELTGVAFVILLIGFLFRKLKLPFIVGYLIVGFFIGPFGFGLLAKSDLLMHLGAIGVLLLLLFIGMEISVPELARNWKVTIIGTVLQILFSIFVIWLIGFWLSWPLPRIILLGFVISLSSTAVVFKLLQDWDLTKTQVGRDVTGILLAQDMAIIPMLMIIELFNEQHLHGPTLLKQSFGGLLVFIVLIYLIRKKEIKLPFPLLWKGGHEIEIFGAAFI